MIPSTADIESATLCAWPALQVAHDRLWIWRAAGGYSKRANSIHCLDPSDGDDADARLARMAELYRYNELPPVFRVTPLTSPGALAALDRAGWQPFETSLVLAQTLPDEDFEVRAKVTLHDLRDPGWFDHPPGTQPRRVSSDPDYGSPVRRGLPPGASPKFETRPVDHSTMKHS